MGRHPPLPYRRQARQRGRRLPNAVVLGGLPLHRGEGYVVSYNTPAEVREVAAALAVLDLASFLARYRALDQEEYGAPTDQAGLECLNSYLGKITTFYQRAAQAGWASVFVADQ